MLGRVLVLSASAGAGHLRAAEAIEKAIRLRGLASEVQHSTYSSTRTRSSATSIPKRISTWSTMHPRFWAGCMTISMTPRRTIRFVWHLIV